MKKIDDRFIFLIGQARHRLFTRLNKALIGRAGITAAQSGALYFLLDHDGCPLTELSRALMLDKSAITGLVDRLEKKELVKRCAAPSDRRSLNVHITDAGRAAAMQCLAVTKEHNAAIKEEFSEQELATFSRMLQAIIGRFSE